MPNNDYIPVRSTIQEIIRHTPHEWTFRMTYDDALSVKPSQFFEISLPKYGESPISVSGIAPGLLDFTIRKIGHVTNELFNYTEGESLYIRGPYGNGFDLEQYKGKELVIVAGGTGVSPVRGVIEYFADHMEETRGVHVIAGFRDVNEILFRADFAKWRKVMDVTMTLDTGEPTEEYGIGLVTKYIPDLKVEDPANAEAIVAGPPVMIKFAAKALAETGFPETHMWVDESRKMCCGLGKCGHCRVNDTYICKDGPVFNYATVKQLSD
jgi:anaerobic sulfite reductase subunit B